LLLAPGGEVSSFEAFGEEVVGGGGGFDAVVVVGEVEFFVGGVDAVVGEAEAQEEGIDAELFLEPGDDGDGAALALVRG